MMNIQNPDSLTSAQRVMLVLLRTLIGWHFLYEGYYKMLSPAWSADGKPLAAWSSAGYLKAASGPFAGMFRLMSEPGWVLWVDRIVMVGLMLIGLSLMLGLLTRWGCWGAIVFLSLFYLAAIPVSGTPQPGSEGTYLFINKTLIELAAVMILLVFRTGEIAGLDVARRKAAMRIPKEEEVMAQRVA